METKFNFNSQVCTSIIQSERLLTLGLKKETADCIHFHTKEKGWEILVLEEGDTAKYVEGFEIPAWSPHRLLSLLPKEIPCEEENGLGMYLGKRYAISYFGVLGYYTHENLYDAVILCIEDVIKEGYFNKEYLENGN